MSFVGRKQERMLTVFGRYMRIACQKRAKVLGIPHYSWSQLSKDAQTERSLLIRAVSGETKPEVETVWKWIHVLQPGERLEKLICRSLKYSTESEFLESEAVIDQVEKEF